MILVPKHQLENKPKHLRLNGATTGSTSLAAPGTGLVYVPTYFFCSASGIASITIYNGTGGSALFEVKVGSGMYELCFWEEPSLMSANKAPVIEANAGVGVHDAHLWVIAVRGGAGQDALTQ